MQVIQSIIVIILLLARPSLYFWPRNNQHSLARSMDLLPIKAFCESRTIVLKGFCGSKPADTAINTKADIGGLCAGFGIGVQDLLMSNGNRSALPTLAIQRLQ